MCGVPDEDDARMRVSGKNGSGGGGIPHLRRTFLVEGDLDRKEEDFRGESKGVCDFKKHGVRYRLG